MEQDDRRNSGVPATASLSFRTGPCIANYRSYCEFTTALEMRGTRDTVWFFRPSEPLRNPVSRNCDSFSLNLFLLDM